MYTQHSSPPWKGAGSGEGVLARIANTHENTIQFVVDLTIGETQDAHIVCGECQVTRRVVVCLGRVNWTIQFDHEVSGGAVEINNEASDHLLTSPVHPIEPMGA